MTVEDESTGPGTVVTLGGSEGTGVEGQFPAGVDVTEVLKSVYYGTEPPEGISLEIELAHDSNDNLYPYIEIADYIEEADGDAMASHEAGRTGIKLNELAIALSPHLGTLDRLLSIPIRHLDREGLPASSWEDRKLQARAIGELFRAGWGSVAELDELFIELLDDMKSRILKHLSEYVGRTVQVEDDVVDLPLKRVADGLQYTRGVIDPP